MASSKQACINLCKLLSLASFCLWFLLSEDLALITTVEVISNVSSKF